MSENFSLVEGNLVADPEAVATKSGKTVLKWTIAENVRVKDASGQWVDGDPNFYDCEYWPNDPQYWLKRLGKGTGVALVAQLKQDRWEQDGQKRSKVKLNVKAIYGKWLPELVAPKQAEQPAQGQPAQGNNPDGLPDDPPF